MTDTTLGRRIAEQRRMRSLSQEAFGEKMGVTRQSISKWESDIATPEVEKLIAMSKLFNVSVGWLLGVEDAELSKDPEELPADLLEELRPLEPIADPAPPPPPPAPTAVPKLHWGSLLCAVLAMFSVVLSCIALTREPEVPEVSTGPDPVLLAQVEDLEQQLLQAQSTQEQLRDLIIDTRMWFSDDSHRMEETIAGLLDLKYVVDQLVTNSSTSDLPHYASLSQWSLTGTPSDDLTTVTLRLECTTAALTDGVLLLIQHGEEKQEVPCILDGTSCTAEYTLPTADGYQYSLLLDHTDGSTERIALEGHGLSDLAASTTPQLFSVPYIDPIYKNYSQTQFWIRFENLYLSTPVLCGKDVSCQWTDLCITYYHNEVRICQDSVVEDLGIEISDPSQRSVIFKTPSKTYSISRYQEGDRHEICLEGTLTINGTATTFSLPMIGWTIQEGEFQQIDY